APGTANSTTFLPLNSSSVVISAMPSLPRYLNLADGTLSPTLIVIFEPLSLIAVARVIVPPKCEDGRGRPPRADARIVFPPPKSTPLRGATASSCRPSRAFAPTGRRPGRARPGRPPRSEAREAAGLRAHAAHRPR